MKQTKQSNSKTLSSLRVSENTLNHMNQAIKKYNDDPQHIVKLTQNEFRRLSFELLSQSIIQGIPIPIQLQM